MSSNNNQIILAMISRGQSVLAEFTIAQGNFQQLARTVLSKVTQNQPKTFSYENQFFHCLSYNEFIFLCMSDKNYPRKLAFQFLQDIQQAFLDKTNEDLRRNAVAYSMQKVFESTFRQKIEKYNDPSEDKFGLLKKNIQETTDVVIEDLNKILQRSERIDLLVKKSDQMSVVSTSVAQQAKQIRRRMQCRNIKLWILISLIGILVIYIILVLSCGGFGLPDCV